MVLELYNTYRARCLLFSIFNHPAPTIKEFKESCTIYLTLAPTISLLHHASYLKHPLGEELGKWMHTCAARFTTTAYDTMMGVLAVMPAILILIHQPVQQLS